MTIYDVTQTATASVASTSGLGMTDNQDTTSLKYLSDNPDDYYTIMGGSSLMSRWGTTHQCIDSALLSPRLVRAIAPIDPLVIDARRKVSLISSALRLQAILRETQAELDTINEQLAQLQHINAAKVMELERQKDELAKQRYDIAVLRSRFMTPPPPSLRTTADGACLVGRQNDNLKESPGENALVATPCGAARRKRESPCRRDSKQESKSFKRRCIETRDAFRKGNAILTLQQHGITCRDTWRAWLKRNHPDQNKTADQQIVAQVIALGRLLGY